LARGNGAKVITSGLNAIAARGPFFRQKGRGPRLLIAVKAVSRNNAKDKHPIEALSGKHEESWPKFWRRFLLSDMAEIHQRRMRGGSNGGPNGLARRRPASFNESSSCLPEDAWEKQWKPPGRKNP